MLGRRSSLIGQCTSITTVGKEPRSSSNSQSRDKAIQRSIDHSPSGSLHDLKLVTRLYTKALSFGNRRIFSEVTHEYMVETASLDLTLHPSTRSVAHLDPASSPHLI